MKTPIRLLLLLGTALPISAATTARAPAPAAAVEPPWVQAAGMITQVMQGGAVDAPARLLDLWNRVPPERREQLLIGFVAVWRQAPPQNKQRLIQASLGAWQRSTPEQKVQIRQGMKSLWQGASPPQRNTLAGAMAAVYDEAAEPEKKIIREEAAGELAQYLAPDSGLGAIAGTLLGSLSKVAGGMSLPGFASRAK